MPNHSLTVKRYQKKKHPLQAIALLAVILAAGVAIFVAWDILQRDRDARERTAERTAQVEQQQRDRDAEAAAERKRQREADAERKAEAAAARKREAAKAVATSLKEGLRSRLRRVRQRRL